MYDHLDEIENEFKEIHEEQKNKDEVDPKMQKIYRNNLFLYLAYMILPIILSIFILIALTDIDFFFKDVNASEFAITNAVNDVNGLLIVDPNNFENLDSAYESFLIPVGADGTHIIYVHASATFITDTDFFDSVLEGDVYTYTLKASVLNDIIDGNIKKWPNNAQINFHIPYDDVSPLVAGSSVDNIIELTKENSVPTVALNAIFAFTLMLIIAIPMVIISKPILIGDFNLLKVDNESVGTVLAKSGIGVLYMFGGNIAVGILVMAISTMFQIPDQVSANQLAINLMLKSPYFILMIITAVVIGPIVEELVFRKSFFGLIKNEKWALVISSLVFGLIHISTEILTGDIGMVIVSSLPYIAGGFIFGYIYMINKKNIVIPIIAHMGYNLISVLMSMFLLYVL
ncbi:CPBP family intramembrane glutamic endopeptidase [Acholeplasma laidlawii]|uniref:CPBP family intramembrane glutamic endopeptidase n=1 Tax=Acholeplasma laidlawii TaxID=2148 RepID=UPI00084C43E4|nr:type II CAAX endopeptidase family protein [Acholeplasma laidlawii]OED59442.1 hypothetical protein BHS12_03795 [Acholeplasma laidlawii]